ncbi:MAG: TadE/TadG family type IV pilus assembly protein [Altererythrobacter sp.]
MLRVLKDCAGNVFPLAAVGLIVLAGMVGGGVDISRAYMAQNRLQNACDAGVLAGRKAVGSDGYDSDAEDQAEAFFATNFDAGEQGVTELTFETDSDDDGNTVEGTASANMSTAVMQLFGFESMPISVECSASMSIGNSDVMMVLDTTGSMDWDVSSYDRTSRIDALRDAMKSFYDTLSAAASGGNGRIRYGFVPYSSSVNVGQLLLDRDPSFLADNWTYQSREPQYRTVTHQVVSGYEAPYETTDTGYSDVDSSGWYYNSSDNYRKRRQCEDDLPPSTSWSNYGGTSTSTTTYIDSQQRRVTRTTTEQRQRSRDYTCYKNSGRYYIIYRNQERTLYDHEYSIEDPIFTTTTTSVFDHFAYKAVNYDTSTYKTFASTLTPTGNSGSNQSSTWEGCIEERATVAENSFSFSKLLGITPAGANDLDIDSAPTGDADTKWGPMWDQISYYRTTSSGRYLTSASVSDYGSKAGAACPVAARLYAEMTESEFDAYADSLDPEGATYLDLGMIWGARLASPDGIFSSNVNDAPSNGGSVARHIIFMTDGQMDTSYTTHSTYGIEYHDRRVTDDGTSNQDGRHTSRFLAVCEAAKAKGIRIWVIAFTSALTSDLETCASPDSSFTASNAASLNEAFQSIGKVVGELRVTQ